MYDTLHQLQQDGALVDLRRDDVDGSSIRCFVTALTADFAVLAIVDDSCEFNGVSVVRTDDVSFVRWGNERLRAWARVLQESPSSPEAAGFLDLAGWESVVRSAAGRVPVVTFHRERRDDEVCQIGTEIEVRGGDVVADEITTEGTVDGRFAIELDDLTRVDFGGGYERALWRMVRHSGGA